MGDERHPLASSLDGDNRLGDAFQAAIFPVIPGLFQCNLSMLISCLLPHLVLAI